MKKILILMIILNIFLVFGNGQKILAADCTSSFSGVAHCGTDFGGATSMYGEFVTNNADWWCEGGCFLSPAGDCNNPDPDYSFCLNKKIYDLNCNTCSGMIPGTGPCDCTSVNETDCTAQAVCQSGYNYNKECVNFATTNSNPALCVESRSASCGIDTSTKSCTAACCTAHFGAGSCCDTGICKGPADPVCLVCDCTADGCCNGAGCVATDNGDPDCTCGELNGTNCGVAGSCAFGVTEITNHSKTGVEICCDGACASGCTSTCFTGHCLPALANATDTGDTCCNGVGNKCYKCDTGYVWDSVTGTCVFISGGGGSSGTGHGHYFKYDKDIVLVFTEGAEFLLKIAGGIALLIIIFGGIYYMVSGASPDGQTRAKKIVTYAVIGLAIVLISYIIIATVESFAV